SPLELNITHTSCLLFDCLFVLYNAVVYAQHNSSSNSNLYWSQYHPYPLYRNVHLAGSTFQYKVRYPYFPKSLSPKQTSLLLADLYRKLPDDRIHQMDRLSFSITANCHLFRLSQVPAFDDPLVFYFRLQNYL